VKFGGLKFLESAHVKDLLACLRWAENPRDRVAGFRVLLLVPGIGPKIATRALDCIATAEDPLLGLREFATTARNNDFDAMVSLLGDLRRGETPWPGELTGLRNWYEPMLSLRYDDAPVRIADLRALESIAATYPSRERFLTELTLDPPAATSDEAGDPHRDEEYLTLSTIHSAKGREWRAVYVLNAVDGCMPSDLATDTPAEIEEERRLLYVAMTRAKDHLQLVVPQRFYVHQQAAGGDRHVYAGRTRFIPQAIEHFFDHRAWPPAPRVGAREPSRGHASFDIAARMRNRWRAPS
jgi:DNA helicase-2/ATP-dependent DNA helicase PcrA